MEPTAPRRLLALGDSITAGGGEPRDGVPGRSWARWLAEALGLEAEVRAEDGARAPDVLARQLPDLPAAALGLLYVGVNDARSPGWDRAAFAAGYPRIVAALAARCDDLLLVTLPLDLGRPPAGAGKVGEANRIVREQAARHGAALCPLDDFAGARWLQADAVHPTALGQREIARRARAALARAGRRRRATGAQTATGDAARSAPST